MVDDKYKIWITQVESRHATIKQEIMVQENCDPDSACVKAWAKVVEEVRSYMDKIIRKYNGIS